MKFIYHISVSFMNEGYIVIEIEYKNLDVSDFLDDIKGSALKNACRLATNRALDAAYRAGAGIMEIERNMERKGSSKLSYSVNSDKKRIKKSRFSEDVATLLTSSNPISLFNLMDPPQVVEQQKGKPVHRRRKLAFRIKKGNVIQSRKKFVSTTKTRKGELRYHVFRRGPNKRGKSVMIRGAVPGVHKTLIQDKNQEAMKIRAYKSFNRNFDKVFDREWLKALAKHGQK